MFFNTTANQHIAFLLVLYVLLDWALVASLEINIAYSISFYVKLLSCLFYLASYKKTLFDGDHEGRLDAAFHFSVFAACISMSFFNFFVIESLSRITGIFLIFGGLSGFVLIDELIQLIKAKATPLVFAFASLFLRIFLFSIFVLSLYFLVVGEWQWKIKPLYALLKEW